MIKLFTINGKLLSLNGKLFTLSSIIELVHWQFKPKQFKSNQFKVFKK